MKRLSYKQDALCLKVKRIRRNGLFNEADGKPNSGCVAFVQWLSGGASTFMLFLLCEF